MAAARALTHYQVLQVETNASLEDIAAAYRRGLAEVRSGIARGAPAQQRLLAALKEAYAVLGDPEKRSAYDHARGVSRLAGRRAATRRPAAPKALRHRLEFTGRGGEYFRIWIADLLLILLSLGLYAPWARRRRDRYFCRSIRLAGHRFDCQDSPARMLADRLAAAACLLLLAAAWRYSLPAFAALLPGCLLFAPWLAMRAARRKAKSLRYRGLGFAHDASYSQTLIAVTGHALLVLPTLGLWLPLWHAALKRWRIGALAFAGARFTCAPDVARFCRTYLLSAAILLLPLIAVMALVVAQPAREWPLPPLYAALAAALGLYVLLLLPLARVRLANATWNGTTLGRQRLVCSISFRSYWPLYLGNLALLLLSLGLAWPWTRTREAAYRCRHLALEAAGLETFIALAAKEAGATAGERQVAGAKTAAAKARRKKAAAHAAPADGMTRFAA